MHIGKGGRKTVKWRVGVLENYKCLITFLLMKLQG